MTNLEPTVEAYKYLVSCLPEGHDDRYLYTVQVEYCGHDLWAVTNRTRLLDTDGNWSFSQDWSGDREPITDAELASAEREHEAWKAERLFDLDTALSLAKNAARSMSYRGETAADAYRRTHPEAS